MEKNLKTLLLKHGFSFKKAFGQNFLTDVSLLAEIADASEIDSDDTVLEIGCGAGTLTRALAESANGEEHTDYDSFKQRVREKIKLLEKAGIPYTKEEWWDPNGKARRDDAIQFYLDMGCDGFRVDMAASLVRGKDRLEGVTALWRDYTSYIRKNYPEAVLISEWGYPKESLNAGFDADFMLSMAGLNVIDLRKGYRELVREE